MPGTGNVAEQIEKLKAAASVPGADVLAIAEELAVLSRALANPDPEMAGA